MGQKKRHQTRVPAIGYSPTPTTPASTDATISPYHLWYLDGERGQLWMRAADSITDEQQRGENNASPSTV